MFTVYRFCENQRIYYKLHVCNRTDLSNDLIASKDMDSVVTKIKGVISGIRKWGKDDSLGLSSNKEIYGKDVTIIFEREEVTFRLVRPGIDAVPPLWGNLSVDAPLNKFKNPPSRISVQTMVGTAIIATIALTIILAAHT